MPITNFLRNSNITISIYPVGTVAYTYLLFQFLYFPHLNIFKFNLTFHSSSSLLLPLLQKYTFFLLLFCTHILWIKSSTAKNTTKKECRVRKKNKKMQFTTTKYVKICAIKKEIAGNYFRSSVMCVHAINASMHRE